MKTLKRDRVPTKKLLAYSSINIGSSIFESPMPMIIIAFYAQYTEAALASIGSILLFSKIFDVISDPLTGYLSDLTNTRIGKRKPWIIAGGILGIPILYLLFSPPEDAGGMYFFLAINAYYLVRTLIFVPQIAWGTELSRDYKERSRIASYNNIVMLSSQALLMIMPIIVSSPILPLFDSAEFSPQMMSFIGKIAMIALPIFILIAVLYAPVGKVVTVKKEKTASFKEIVKAFKTNKPMLFFIAADLISLIGLSVFMGVAFIAMDSYLQIGDKLPVFIVTVTIVQVISIPVWEKIIERFGKHQVFAASLVIQALIYPFIFLLEPGQDVFYPFLIIGAIASLFQTPGPIAAAAILGDVIDYDILKGGVNRAGTYLSIYSLIMKGGAAIGASLGLFLLAAFKYDAKGGVNTPEAEFGLMFTMTIVPLIFLIVSGIMFWFFPLTAKRHAIIKERIESRAERAGVTNESIE